MPTIKPQELNNSEKFIRQGYSQDNTLNETMLELELFYRLNP